MESNRFFFFVTHVYLHFLVYMIFCVGLIRSHRFISPWVFFGYISPFKGLLKGGLKHLGGLHPKGFSTNFPWSFKLLTYKGAKGVRWLFRGSLVVAGNKSKQNQVKNNDFWLFNMMFVTFSHGKSPWKTTIWESFCFFFRFFRSILSKSKIKTNKPWGFPCLLLWLIWKVVCHDGLFITKSS